MKLILFNLFACIFNVCAALINYSDHNYEWAVINGVCVGATLMNTIWCIKNKIEE